MTRSLSSLMRELLPGCINFSLICYTFSCIDFYRKNGAYLYMFLSFISAFVCFRIVFFVCDFLFGHTYFVIYLRKFLFQWITNKRMQRYLDSIFLIKYYLFNFDSGTHQNERWKNYIFAFLTFPLTLIIILLPSTIAFFAYIYLFISKLLCKKEIDGYFHFETLPFSIQDRFIELQTPLIKKRLKQIYPWIRYDKLVIDKLHIDAAGNSFDEDLVEYMYDPFIAAEEIEWKNISVSWNFAQSYFEKKTLLVVRFEGGRKMNWNLESIKTFKIVKTAIFNGLKPSEFQYLYNNLNLSMISELEIKKSNLSLKELALIKELNLKSIYLLIELEDGYSSPEMIDFIMDIFVKIPKIRVLFFFFYEGNFFENFLVDWIIKNGYRESFIFTFRLHKSPWLVTFASDSLIISGFYCYHLPM